MLHVYAQRHLSWAPSGADLLAGVTGVALCCPSGALLLTCDPSPGCGYLLLGPASTWDGLRFPSPSSFSLKPSSPAWQAYDQRCSSLSLSDGPHKPLVDSPGYSHGQIAQSPVQPDLEQFPWWGIHSFSGQPVPVPHHSHCKKFLPYVHFKHTLFQLKTGALAPAITDLVKSLSASFL